MQQSIHLLSDETINQIAAGEVIESPASVVKELVENSLDAKASKITVEVVGGGMQKIRITDDGIGMSEGDAKMSIIRHATSKILKAQDLFHIASKGFRGEALASIASISKVTLETAKEDESGTKLEIERGKILKVGKCARMHGTTFEVRALFHNVPARKKFQKNPAALSAEIFRLMTVMSLSHPAVQFELISNGRKAITTRFGETLLERIRALLGDAFYKNSFTVDFKEGPLHFHGLIGAPSESRPNKMSQYLFLNQRAVQCEVISDAVRKGYGTRLDEKRHPLFLLQIDVPADLVDVNVHPQKLQVRLRKEELFRDKVCVAVERAFAKIEDKPTSAGLPSPPAFEFASVNYDEISLRFKEEALEQEPTFAFQEPQFEILGKTGAYLIIDKFDEEGFTLVDLKAASSRVIFEDLISKIETPSEKQGLLVPFNIDLTPVEATMVLTHQGAIEEMGFALKAIGKDTFMVEALPPFLEESRVKMVIASMAHTLQEFIGKIDYEKERKEKLALALSQYARPSQNYSPEEAKRLYESLSQVENQTHCPKGNPTQIHLDHDKIKHLFTADQKTPRVARAS